MPKTLDVKMFVELLLSDLPQPLTEDVTDEIFKLIERSEIHIEEYSSLMSALGHKVVNQWIGRYTRIVLKADVLKRDVPSSNTLCGHYSKLSF